MNESPIYNEAEYLKEGLSKDPVGYYTKLLDFSKNYSASPRIHDDAVLLGSMITEMIEDVSRLHHQGNMHNLSRRGVLIVNEIMQSLESGKLDEEVKVKGHFLKQMPVKETICECKNISRKIASNFSLSGISLKLKLGEITGLVGENGSGKSSLLRIIAGEMMQSSGDISYPLFAGGKKDWGVIKQSIGYVKQNLQPWRSVSSVRQQLQFTAAIKGITGEENEKDFQFIISRLGLQKYQDKLWPELSGGFRLRFELARQLIWKPKLLILDEPLANLDIKTQLFFLNDLRSLTNSMTHSMAVIISSQNLYEIEKISDNLLFIRDGVPIYNGLTSEIGIENRYRCYEIDTPNDTFELQKALEGIEVNEIQNNGYYKLIYTSEYTMGESVLTALSKNKISVTYFRDITNSARLLFEK